MILGIMIGSVMSRGINGSAGIVPTLLGGTALVAMHWLFAMLAYRTRWFGRLVKGDPVLLIENGRLLEDQLRSANVSRHDVEQAIRNTGRPPDPAAVERAFLERDGTISIIPREHVPRIVDVAVADGVQTVRVEFA